MLKIVHADQAAVEGFTVVPGRFFLLTLIITCSLGMLSGLTPVSWRDESLGSGSLA